MSMQNQGNSRAEKYRKRIPRLYLVVVLVMFLMVVINGMERGKEPSSFGLKSYEKMGGEWLGEDGKPFDFKQIDDYVRQDSGELSIYYDIPKVTEESSIVFRSKNAWVEVWLGEEKRYETQRSTAHFYNHSPGTRWNVVSFGPGDSGKRMELKVKLAYQDQRCKIDNFYQGDRGAILLFLIKTKIFGLLVSLLIFFMGIGYLFMDLALNHMRGEKDHSLAYLAVFAMIAAVWCILETNILQLFVKNMRAVQVVDNMMLVLGGMPIFLYMDQLFGIFRSKVVRVLCVANMLYLYLATLSQMFGLWDFHQTLNGAVTTYGLVCAFFIICLIRHNAAKRRKGFYDIMQQLGIAMLALGVLGDFLRYLCMDVMDRAMVIRVGFFGFILCFGSGNIYQLILLVKKGYQMEIVSKLAYTDGLTEIGNRTAYQEKKEELRKREGRERLAVLAFDINNLKQVNDRMGHSAGDQMIRVCVEVIRRTFGELALLYRIGGDEFAALLLDKDPEAVYERTRLRFEAEMKAYDESGNYPFPVSIAYGAAFCEGLSTEDIALAEEEADARMYQKKREMKKESSANGSGL